MNLRKYNVGILSEQQRTWDTKLSLANFSWKSLFSSSLRTISFATIHCMFEIRSQAHFMIKWYRFSIFCDKLVPLTLLLLLFWRRGKKKWAKRKKFWKSIIHFRAQLENWYVLVCNRRKSFLFKSSWLYVHHVIVTIPTNFYFIFFKFEAFEDL